MRLSRLLAGALIVVSSAPGVAAATPRDADSISLEAPGARVSVDPGGHGTHVHTDVPGERGRGPHVTHPRDLPRGAEQPSAAPPYEGEISTEDGPSGASGPTITGITGTASLPVILADFSDQPAERTLHPPSAYEAMLFEDGYAPGDGSMRDYFQDASGGIFDITGDASSWLRMPKTYASYTGSSYGYQMTEPNDWTLVKDAAAAADPSMDFCRFDTDGDAVVDVLFIAHAGPGAEETGSGIWSVSWRLPQPYETADVCANGQRARIAKFVTVPEEYSYAGYSAPDAPERLVGIGIFVHEFGHVLGLPDLYDTDYSSPGGVGPWDVMASGTWGFRGNRPWRPSPLSAWSLTKLGWALPQNVGGDIASAAIPSVDAPRTGVFEGIFRLAPEGSATASEYFLLENREARGWAADFPGGGLALWHVNASRSGNWDDSARLVELVQGDGLLELNLGSYGASGDLGDLLPGSTLLRRIDGTTNPSTDLASGADSGISIESIGDPGATTTAGLFTSPPPTTSPAPPGGLSATRDAGGVHLSWVPSSAEDVLEQRVYRSDGADGFVRIATLGAAVSTLSDPSATEPGASYGYVVRAFNRLESDPSEAVWITVPGPPQALVPRGLDVQVGGAASGSLLSLKERDLKVLDLRSSALRRAHRLEYVLGFSLPEDMDRPGGAKLAVAATSPVNAKVFAFARRTQAWEPVGRLSSGTGTSATLKLERPGRYVTRIHGMRLRLGRSQDAKFGHPLDQVTLWVS